MEEEKVKEYYKILDMYETALYGLKWIHNGGKGHYEALITQFEILQKELLTFDINNIGVED